MLRAECVAIHAFATRLSPALYDYDVVLGAGLAGICFCSRRCMMLLTFARQLAD
jgi:hypothetical protein